jgi:hypothetical protein
MVAEQIKCSVCETPLTGGIDTFGTRGEEVCSTCWYTTAQGNSLTEWDVLALKIKELNYERDSLLRRIDELDEELESIDDKIAPLRKEIEELRPRVGNKRDWDELE